MDWEAAIAQQKYYLSKYIWNDNTLALAARYRAGLTAAGFTEATWPKEGKNLGPKNPLRFYRQDTELTAFFVNLEPAGNGARIFYGFSSTAFTRMKANKTALMEMGVEESNNTLRFVLSVHSDAEETAAAEQIGSVYHKYHGTEKDALLGIIKELRKAWIARITAVLKPLGFKKKGNEWSKVLPGGHILYFAADKGSYADGYNFDVRLRQPPGEIRAGDWCAFAIWEQERDRAIDPFCHHSFDWQLDPTEDLDRVLNHFLTAYYYPLIIQDAELLHSILRCSQKECPVPQCPLRCNP